MDFSLEPEVRLPQRLVKKSLRFGRRAVQCFFTAGNDLGSFRGSSAASVSHDDGGLQVHGSIFRGIGADVGCQHHGKPSKRNAPLVDATAGSVLLILFVRTLESFETPALIGIPARIYVYTSEIFLPLTNIRLIMAAGGVGRRLIVAQCSRWLYALNSREQSFRRSPERLSAETVRSGSVAMDRIVIPHGLFRFCCPVAFPGITVGVIFTVLCGAELGCFSKLSLTTTGTSIPSARFGMR
jgi:hypothetical protein